MKLNKFLNLNFKELFTKSIGSRFRKKVDHAMYINETAVTKAAIAA